MSANLAAAGIPSRHPTPATNYNKLISSVAVMGDVNQMEYWFKRMLTENVPIDK